MRNLILFTDYFPQMYGDYAFIKNEMNALSQNYKTVYIFPLKFSPYKSQATDLPDNVIIFPALFNTKKELLIKNLFNYRSIFKSIYLLITDLKYIKIIKHIKSLILAILIARGQNKIFSDFLKSFPNINPKNTDLYFFWGVGSVYLLTLNQKDFKFKSLVRFHGGDLYLERHKGYIPLRKQIFTMSTQLSSISQLGTNYLNNELKEFKLTKRSKTIYLGTKDYGVSENHKNIQFIIVSCSSIIPLKRVHLIYESLVLIANSKLPIHWIHFGGGQGFEALQSLILKNSNDDLKITLHGQTHHATIISFYKTHKVNLFINVSTTEGIPVSIMEAISFNIPVIATDVGATSEIINQNAKTGILVPAELDAMRLKKSIELFLKLYLNDSNFFEPRVFWNANFTESKANKNLIDSLKQL